MALVSDHPIYDALPISNNALDKGGVELLRAAIVDEELFIVARLVAFRGPAPWGWVLADIARRLASHYAAQDNLTEAEVTAAIVDAFVQSFRGLGASTARLRAPHGREGREGVKPAKSVQGRAKRQVQSRSKSKPSTMARRKGARSKR